MPAQRDQPVRAPALEHLLGQCFLLQLLALLGREPRQDRVGTPARVDLGERKQEGSGKVQSTKGPTVKLRHPKRQGCKAGGN